ncbi:kinase [Caulobacter sp. RHG1]|uniref:kinase n=1 Tax=Caulobacter sp. (strain RHG1) TaxID=2545762 RepID=UPI0015561CE9|nr:kinase [Caulobacter sp. RHG1]NQE61272.1 D-glycerate 3-kinase, plant type [Caulobacter sp. RHG1]
MTASLDAVEQALDGWRGDGPFVLGVCGAQGSGKSTLAEGLTERLTARGLRAATLSLDDLYLSHAERARLGEVVHPLFATRGVPGTHDVALGLRLLSALRAGQDAVLPRFDKATDDPASTGAPVNGPLDVLIFEGWCVGARAQDDAALLAPVNALEAKRDPDATWRRFVNQALATDYADLFARIDRLVLLAAPGFEVVRDWRIQQEHELRARVGEEARTMSDDEIGVFIQHYERLTRHILSDMPAYADLTLRLDEKRRLT